MIVSYYILNREEELAILTDDSDLIALVKINTWLIDHSFKKMHFIVWDTCKLHIKELKVGLYLQINLF